MTVKGPSPRQSPEATGPDIQTGPPTNEESIHVTREKETGQSQDQSGPNQPDSTPQTLTGASTWALARGQEVDHRQTLEQAGIDFSAIDWARVFALVFSLVELFRSGRADLKVQISQHGGDTARCEDLCAAIEHNLQAAAICCAHCCDEAGV
jgi:hypothetical protein